LCQQDKEDVKKKEEKGSRRRRYDNNNNDVHKDMNGRGQEGEGEEEGWWNDHRCMQHVQHPRLPPGNDEGGYEDKDIPIILALDLGKAADHFLTVAVLSSAFSLPLLSSSRAAAAAAG
jgi:hypothetical protein